MYQTVHDPGDDCWQEREGGSANVRAPSAADVKVVSSAQSGLSSVCRTEEQGAPSAVSSRDPDPLLLLVRELEKEEIESDTWKVNL